MSAGKKRGRPSLGPGQRGKECARELGENRWKISQRIGLREGSVEITATGTSAVEARDRLNQRIEERFEDDSAGATKGNRYNFNTPLSVLFERDLEDAQREGRMAPQTLQRREGSVRKHLIPMLGHLTIRQATHQRLDQEMRNWEDKTGFSSKHLRPPLREAMRLAKKFGPLDHNPADLISKPKKKPPSPVVAMTLDEYQKLRDAILKRNKGTTKVSDPALLLDVVDMMAGTGLRPGEALALRCRDLEPVGEEYCVMVCGTMVEGHRQPWTKTKLDRQVIADAVLAPMITKRLKAQPDPDGPLFPSRSGTWWPKKTFSDQFIAARKLAGLRDDLHPHELRKFAATEVATALSLEAAQDLLGHQSLDITLTYYIADTELDQTNFDIADMLDEVVGVFVSGDQDEAAASPTHEHHFTQETTL